MRPSYLADLSIIPGVGDPVIWTPVVFLATLVPVMLGLVFTTIGIGVVTEEEKVLFMHSGVRCQCRLCKLCFRYSNCNSGVYSYFVVDRGWCFLCEKKCLRFRHTHLVNRIRTEAQTLKVCELEIPRP